MSLVRIVGNAPSIAEVEFDDSPCTYIALNLAPLIMQKRSISKYYCWIQDWRFFSQKGTLLASESFDGMSIATVDDAIIPSRFTNVARYRLLGRQGFSFDPTTGIYQGYTAAYGAIQFSLIFNPTVIEMYGVDLNYGLRPTRFYQDAIGWDQDLHVHARQIKNLQEAEYSLRKFRGIEIVYKTPSLVRNFIARN